jgi:hypothetical protein
VTLEDGAWEGSLVKLLSGEKAATTISSLAPGANQSYTYVLKAEARALCGAQMRANACVYACVCACADANAS